MYTMGLVDHPQPDTTVARLHLSLEKAQKPQVIEDIQQQSQTVDGFPSGATIIEGTGLWFPDDETKHEIEDNLIIELWIDSKQELEAVRDFKADLENRYNQHCVCLSLEDKYFEHDRGGDDSE